MDVSVFYSRAQRPLRPMRLKIQHFDVRRPLMIAALLLPTTLLHAADPTFVGVLALTVEDEGARKLGISDRTRQSLLDLIDRREQAALNIALDIKDLPEAEIAARLAPFVAESERQGMALLTIEQRDILRQMRVARLGMDSLRDSELAQVLELSDLQQATVQELVQQRAQDMTRGGENQRRITRALYERKLADVLTEEQRNNWQRLAGMNSADGQLAQQEVDTASPEAVSQEAASQKEQQDDASTQRPGLETVVAEATAASEEAAESSGRDEVKLRFNFHHQPWEEVLQWFAEEADLSLLTEFYPQGTFNYRDSRTYSPSQAIDLMNSVLLTKGFTLVRRERLVTLVNFEEDEIPPQLVELVDVSELDQRGEFELIKCLFQLAKLDAADAEAEVSKLIGPQGAIVALPKAGQILVTETAGRLRTIHSVIQSVENPTGASQQGIVEVALKYVTPEDVLTVARPLLSLEEGSNVSEDIRIAIDPFTSRLFATGTREFVQKLQEIVPLVDRAPDTQQGPVAALEQPQMASYQIAKADAAQALAVVQTLLAGLPDVRLSVDPVTNKLIVLARPSEHRTIVETLRMLEGDADRTEVIQLRHDPELIILSINKLFGLDSEEASTTGPRVDGDPSTMRLWVRGTPTQIAQIRELVEQIEGPEGELGTGVRQNLRILPFSGSSVQSALKNAELIFRATRGSQGNRIRIISPSTLTPSVRERTPAARLEPPQRAVPQDEPAEGPPAAQGAAAPGDSRSGEQHRIPKDRAAHRSAAVRARFVSFPDEPRAASQREEGDADGDSAQPAAVGTPAENEQPQEGQQNPPDIIVQLTPSGLIIASDDLDALDDFENLLRTLMESSAGGSEPTVFWLKYAKADVVGETLQQVLGGGSTSGVPGPDQGRRGRAAHGRVPDEPEPAPQQGRERRGPSQP